MIRYYQEIRGECKGDFLALETTSNSYYRRLGRDEFECRAVAIAGQVGSVCTCSVSRKYLQKNCRRVDKSQVPAEWLKAFGLEDQ